MAKDTRARMLETTARLLQHRGYHGTSLSDILEASGAPRGSLYFHFPGGKDQLVLEATRAAVEATTRELRDTLAMAKTPAQGVRTFVEAAAQILRETDYTFGCPVAPVILDATDSLPELAELCRQAFEEWVGLLRSSFVGAGIPDRRAHALALLVESSIEGLLLVARAYRDTSALITVAAELEAIVDAALPCGIQRSSAVGS
jgi:TetR/AcrR family transcriptional regulator, lmrAB and yxaGH operons repressor